MWLCHSTVSRHIQAAPHNLPVLLEITFLRTNLHLLREYFTSVEPGSRTNLNLSDAYLLVWSLRKLGIRICSPIWLKKWNSVAASVFRKIPSKSNGGSIDFSASQSFFLLRPNRWKVNSYMKVCIFRKGANKKGSLYRCLLETIGIVYSLLFLLLPLYFAYFSSVS